MPVVLSARLSRALIILIKTISIAQDKYNSVDTRLDKAMPYLSLVLSLFLLSRFFFKLSNLSYITIEERYVKLHIHSVTVLIYVNNFNQFA